MNLNLLIVDDEKNIRSSLSRSLKKWATENNINLVTADSAGTALQFLEQKNKQTAVIISDHQMPLRKGTVFLKEIAELYPNIICIMLSGHVGVSDISDMITAGLHCFLEKPWDKEILLTKVSEALALYKQRQEENEKSKTQDAEMEIASDFQKKFFKVEIPQSEHFSFNLTHQHARELLFGGDYYDIIPFINEKYMLLLGDVAGHGLKASFLAAILKSISISEYLNQKRALPSSPGAFLSWLNNKFYKILNRTPDLFLAFSACYLDGNRGTVTIANGGQPPPLLATEGRIIETCQPQIALGVEDDYRYSEVTFQLNPGDLVFMCTDGIYPNMSESSALDKELFYELLQKMRTTGEGPDLMVNALGTDKKNILYADDITIMSAQFNFPE